MIPNQQSLFSIPEQISYLNCAFTGPLLKTAQAAGMYPVGVVWGFRPREELEENGARTLLQSPLEILALLD